MPTSPPCSRNPSHGRRWRQGELITAEVDARRLQHRRRQRRTQVESFSFIEEFNDKGGVEGRPAISSPSPSRAWKSGYGETRLSSDKAKRLKAWHDSRHGAGHHRLRPGHTGKGEGWDDRDGQHTCLPARLADIRPVKDTAPFEGKALVSSSRPQAQQRCRVAPRGTRGPAPSARNCSRRFRKARSCQGHRQEHHRLRRVRRPG